MQKLPRACPSHPAFHLHLISVWCVCVILPSGAAHPRKVSNAELVLEVGGGLPEGGRHTLVQLQRRLHHLLACLCHVGGEAAEVAAEESRVDGVERIGSREPDGERGEEPLQPGVDLGRSAW